MAKSKAELSHRTAFMGQDATLSYYLKSIAKSRPLTSREEAELTVRIRNGDREALHRLVVANLRFVVSVCRSYEHQGLPLIDLINEGNIGLISAARRFDETKNFRFISYAVWWIRQAILQVLAQQSRITRLPLSRAGCIHRIGKAQRKLEQSLHRQPSADEIAVYLGISRRVVESMIQISARHASLDATFESTKRGFHDLLASTLFEEMDDRLVEGSLHKGMAEALEVLDEREQDIIRLYFGVDYELPHTLEEIGLKLSITRERVRQIKQKALSKLQQSESIGCLRTYLHEN